MDINRFMSREEIKETVEVLKSLGKTVYSISRLNSFHDCEYGYYRTYVEGDRGENGVYGVLGGLIHDHLENVCNGKETVEDMRTKFEDEYFETLLFTPFPSEKIENGWRRSIDHFLNTFEPLEYEVITEQGFIVEIDGVYVQGYIDVLRLDDKVWVLDWKTSSSFSKDKLLHAGRQLVLYNLAVEKITGRKVDKVAWYMLKYVYAYYDKKVKQVERGKLVDGLSGLIKTQLKKLGYDEFSIETMLGVASEENSLESLPQEVQYRFTFEPCIVEYEVTPELIEELKEYIVNTTSAIEGKNTKDYKGWKCKSINPSTVFFCNNLCGFRNNGCALIKWYNENNK